MELSTIMYLTLFAALATLLCYWHFCPASKSAAGVAAPAPSGAPASKKSPGPDSAAGS